MPRPKQDDTLQFRLTITCENAAFEDSPEAEIARILRTMAARLDPGYDPDTLATVVILRDHNGNDVGQAGLKTVYEHENARRHDRAKWLASRASALLLGAFLALSAWGCTKTPTDLVTVAQLTDGSFSVDVYDADGKLATTAHLMADALMADAFPKGAPK